MAAMASQMLRAWREKKAIDEAFRQYSAALVSQDFDEAYSYCGEDFRQATSFEDFVRQQEGLLSRFGRLTSIRQAGSIVEVRKAPPGKTALIEADHQYEAKTVRFIYEFQGQGERWVLFGYKLK